MHSGQQEKALEGFYRWLEGGGRQRLSKLATDRFKRRQNLAYWRQITRRVD